MTPQEPQLPEPDWRSSANFDNDEIRRICEEAIARGRSHDRQMRRKVKYALGVVLAVAGSVVAFGISLAS